MEYVKRTYNSVTELQARFLYLIDSLILRPSGWPFALFVNVLRAEGLVLSRQKELPPWALTPFAMLILRPSRWPFALFVYKLLNIIGLAVY